MSKFSAHLVAQLSEAGLLDGDRSTRIVSSYERKDLEALSDEYDASSRSGAAEFLSATRDPSRMTLLPSHRLRGGDNLAWFARAALYVDTVIVQSRLGMLGGLKAGVTVGYVKEELLRSLTRLQTLAPLVGAGFVEFLPP